MKIKVVCIDSTPSITDYFEFTNLTMYKVYDAVNADDRQYLIIDDMNICQHYFKYRFKLLEEVREIKINILLEC